MSAPPETPRTAAVDTLDAFARAFDEALPTRDLTTIVAKVDAVGPARFVADLGLLENRFAFARALRREPTA
jgi:sulfopyruvate decarboxylase subunit beta